MRWVIRNSKLFEALGLFLLLTGWFLNSLSLDKWNGRAQELDTFIEMMFRRYGEMQTAANIRLEASVSRKMSPQTKLEADDNEITSYRDAWHSGEVRQRYLAQVANNVFSLGQITDKLRRVNAESQLGGASILEEPQKCIDEIVESLLQVTNGQQMSPARMPVPDLQKLPIQRAREIDDSLTKASELVLTAHQEIADLVSKKKESLTMLYNLIFVLGSILTVLSKFAEWVYEVIQRRSADGRNAL